MVLHILLLVAGLALVVFGADALVDGASSLARKWGVSEFIIGMTIVGFGTSCPELVVSLTGAANGSADICIGNVLGSNIFNTLLILGLTALLRPINVTLGNMRRDIPITMLVTLLFVGLGLLGGGIGRIDGAVFLLLFIAYMWFCFRVNTPETEEDEVKRMAVWKSVVYVVAGLAALIFGGRLFVDSAVRIASLAGVSEKFIAVTILAGGTSLPELATCIVAASKKRDQLALGNILGSNIFNILLILGLSSLVTPLSFRGISAVDLIAISASMIILWAVSVIGKGKSISRTEGAVLLAAQAAYVTLLIVNLQ